MIDAQLPPSLANHLTSCGHEAIHVFDIGLTTAADKVIWTHAAVIGVQSLERGDTIVEISDR